MHVIRIAAHAFLLFISLLLIQAARADDAVVSHHICRGESPTWCSGPQDTFIGCSDVSTVKNYICGGGKLLTLQKLGERSGGRCGYADYTAACEPPPKTDSLANVLRLILVAAISGAAAAASVLFLAFVAPGPFKKVAANAAAAEDAKTRANQLLRWIAIVGGIVGLSLGLYQTYLWFFESKTIVSLSKLLSISSALAAPTDDGTKQAISAVLPWIASGILLLMGIAFLAALGIILLVPDTKENQARIKSADNIVKTFGGFFTGLATTLLK